MRGYHIRIQLVQRLVGPHNSETFIPTSLFQDLPTHTPKSTSRKNATFNPKDKDYRFGPIRLDWVNLANTSSMNKAGKERESRRQGQVSASFVPNSQDKNGSTNLPEGVVHIFSDPANTESSSLPNIQVSPDENMLAVLAVPSWMTPSDFLAFVAPAADGIVHLRMIRDSMPNRSMVVIQLRTSDNLSEFVEVYNGKSFNSMEPEICHVVKVLSVSINADDQTYLSISRFGSVQGPMYELPTCPVCLERMDSAVTGLVTVPCSHTFHCMCLSKWGDSRCPVCRYSQTLLSSHPTSVNTTRSTVPVPFTNPSTPSLSTCVDCPSTTNLWICLICGNIGCGRYGRAHAQAHYEKTTHLYALELETQRVWDYAGDGYVHRLIQNKADGKLVELPSAATSTSGNGAGEGGRGGLGPSSSDTLTAEKIEAIGIEYSYLLTSQLDSQRVFYEEQMKGLEGKVDELKGLVERLAGEVDQGRKTAAQTQERKKAEAEEKLSELEREKIRSEKRSEKLTELTRKLEKELKEERIVSEGLLENLKKMREKVEQADREKAESGSRVSELEDQVRDVMFFLEARNKIEAGEDGISEAAGGSLEIHSNPPKSSGKKKGKKG